MGCFCPSLLGFVGRHVAHHIHQNNLASELRIVDKLLPQLAWLAPEFEQACSKEQFVQADASRERKSFYENHFPCNMINLRTA